MKRGIFLSINMDSLNILQNFDVFFLVFFLVLRFAQLFPIRDDNWPIGFFHYFVAGIRVNVLENDIDRAFMGVRV